MKQKQTMLIALIFALAFIGCDDKPDDPQDDPKDQSTPINGLFGGNYSATVKGHFTDTQWNGVPNKVKRVLDNAMDVTPPMGRNGRQTYFENNAVIIIVQSTTEYTKYKVVETESAVLYLNIVALDSELPIGWGSENWEQNGWTAGILTFLGSGQTHSE